MDLAKIRKKARLGLNAFTVAVGAEIATKEIGQTLKQSDDRRPLDSSTQPAESRSDAQLTAAEPMPQVFQPHSLRMDSNRSPLERIIAGRVSAGCDEEPQDELPEQVALADASFDEFLCIRVSNETYGINIMQIKEIITPCQVTEVPRSPLFVRGVISLRGVIIPVLDMNDRLGLNRRASGGRERVVVVKSGTGDSFTGLLVDQVTHVARVSVNRIEPAPSTLSGIDRDFVSGIGRDDNSLIILLNIESIVDIQLF